MSRVGLQHQGGRRGTTGQKARRLALNRHARTGWPLERGRPARSRRLHSTTEIEEVEEFIDSDMMIDSPAEQLWATCPNLCQICLALLRGPIHRGLLPWQCTIQDV